MPGSTRSRPPRSGSAGQVRATGQRKGDPIARKTQASGRKAPAATKKLLGLVEKSLDDDKAEDVVAIDLSGKSSIADFMVIASGRSSRQLGAMAEHLQVKLKASGISPVGIEGATAGDWVLIDGGDIVIHLFRPEIRQHYGLEKMWGLPESERALSVG
jgi:ribosome-associated protein